MISIREPGIGAGPKGFERRRPGEAPARRPFARASLTRRPSSAGGIPLEHRRIITTRVIGKPLNGTLKKALDHMCGKGAYSGQKEHRVIFESRFGITDGIARTREEVAAMHNTTPEEVLRIEDAFFRDMISGPHGQDICRHLAANSARSG